jgi:phosphohistidine phosphatase
MKTLYFIRHAKAKNFEIGESDFERTLSKKGHKDIKTIGSYLKLRGISPDRVLCSCALRAQESATELMEILEFQGHIDYLEQLYMTSIEEITEIIGVQDDTIGSMFVIGHHPYLTEFVNTLSQEHIAKIPSMGVVCINFDIKSWKEIATCKGELEFFIFPKQFKYYMPKQIRATLQR